MPWWAWIVVGLVLAGAEMMVPLDFYLLLVGVSALAVGLLDLAGLQLGIGGQLLLLGALSIASAAAYQGWIKPRLARAPAEPVDALEGTVAVARVATAAGGAGSVELRGAQWAARNVGPVPLDVGDRCVVERVDGLTLHVRKED